ncbi:hypothetical protein M2341_000943 [Sphingobium sp. B7D2B]|uniref:DUF3037 domain-containing protein n=1 Tax=Sphingobium sp. B7D2B TaxID=2940583 RepID=UPI0022258248|nr:DUF3037 domain-containing protein [Sphingobium sp. B7D2B]MCW2365496.1 hypothetical protein [Sphingobium sp. B7D2B]
MVQSFKFAVVRLSPGGVRDERINVGLAVFSENDIDLRLTQRLDKIRVLSASLDQSILRELADTLVSRDFDLRAAGIHDAEARRHSIGSVGPLTFSHLGTFTCSSEREYGARIDSIFESIINPEPAPPVVREKRSKLLTQLKRALRKQRVLAKADEGLSSHRVVPNLMLADGLIADLALKNGRMHIFETVDISAPQTTARKAVSDIAVSALVLEQARIVFGEKDTKARLVYSACSTLEKAAHSCLEAAAHQGAELINWSSDADKIKLVYSIASLAIPTETARERSKRLADQDTFQLKLH